MPAVVLWVLMLPQTSGCTRGSWEIAISDPTGHNWICWYIYKGENGTSDSIETSSEPRHITVQNQDAIFLSLLSEIDGIAIRGLLPYEVGDRPETWNSEEFVKEIWYRLYKAGDFQQRQVSGRFAEVDKFCSTMVITEWAILNSRPGSWLRLLVMENPESCWIRYSFYNLNFPPLHNAVPIKLGYVLDMLEGKLSSSIAKDS